MIIFLEIFINFLKYRFYIALILYDITLLIIEIYFINSFLKEVLLFFFIKVSYNFSFLQKFGLKLLTI